MPRSSSGLIMASSSKRAKVSYSVEPVADICSISVEKDDSDIDSDPEGMSSDEDFFLDEELLREAESSDQST